MAMFNLQSKYKKLITPCQIREHGKDWQQDSFNEIETRLNKDSDFPCVFSKNACRKDLLRFIFVENSGEKAIQHFADGLAEYVDVSKSWDGTLDTAYPLLVVFSQDAIFSTSVSDYHAFGWNIIQELHELDPKPWPADVANTPTSHAWSMCFNGMPLFFNMSNPGHSVRLSRNLGKYFVMVINPRERFDIFAGNNPAGRKMRANIRNRIKLYDGVEHSPQLGSYGDGGVEWWQYGLIEENVERTDQCPFMKEEIIP